MSITLTKISTMEYMTAVGWIVDTFPGQEVEATHLTPQQAYRVVQRHYDGGWKQFLSDLG